MRMLLEGQIIDRLRKLKARMATVESCTGGLIAHRMTNVPGASDVFFGSLVVYDNAAKTEFVGVAPELIEAHGAVSPEVALSLARGGVEKISVGDYRVCIATTGIAGPAGGTPLKPVGLCFIAFADSNGKEISRKILAPQTLSRVQIKDYFAEQALSLVLESIDGT